MKKIMIRLSIITAALLVCGGQSAYLSTENVSAQSASNWLPLQVTLGSSATQVSPQGTGVNCTIIDFQNNAAHNVRLGDSTVTTSRGLLITSGSEYHLQDGRVHALSQYYLAGTQGDVIDVGCQQAW